MDEREQHPDQPHYPPVAPPPPKRRGRTILIVVGAIVGFLIVVGAIGAAVGKSPTASTAANVLRTPSTPLATHPSPTPAASSAAPRLTAPASAKSKPLPHTSSAAPTTAAPSPSCTLPDDQDLIVRYTVPGLQDAAQELGEVDLENCSSTLDYLQQTSPTGDGYCTEVAWAADNPGYNADATPAAPLKKVIEAIGPAC